MRIVGDRSRARLLDRLIKDKKNRWASLVVVGVKDDLEAKSLLQWCRNLAVTVVWRTEPNASRQQAQRQAFARDRMRKWGVTYKRFTLIESSTADAAKALKGQQFDAVALWGLTPAQLASEGADWAALVVDGGMLVGLDHRLVECRRVLNVAVPKWRTFRDGVWVVDVRRQGHAEAAAEDGGENIGAKETAAEQAVESSDANGGAVLDDAADGAVTIKADVTHDPASSASDAATLPQPAPKRRGRPPGSKSKVPGVAAARGRKATA